VNETAVGSVLRDERQIDAGLRAVDDLHGRLIGAHVGLHPAGVDDDGDEAAPGARETLDLGSLVISVCDDAAMAGAEVEAVLGEPVVIEGDPTALQRLFANLIDNAVKYSAGRQPAVIAIRGEVRDGAVHYSVADNGVGFDMKYADKLFGVFQRLHSMDEYPGTGVGLAIVQRIINRHEGAVTAKGERGKGATFGFTLPTEV